jgi:N-acetylneuraminate synthase
MFSDRTFIIAEAGVNHNGDLECALELVRVAAESGADAVKFQSFKAEQVASAHASKARYQELTTGAEESQLEMLRRLELAPKAESVVAKECKKFGIEYMSTPSDSENSDRLVNEIKVSKIKIGSSELTNAPLLLHVGRLGRPIILSTGMATLTEVEQALGIIAFGISGKSDSQISRAAFAEEFRSSMASGSLNKVVTLLHCTTEYPAPVESLNLKAMATLHDTFSLRVGLSDHSRGIHIAPAAVAMGACVIEKHFTLDRGLPGPDHRASVEPRELSAMVAAIRDVEIALGKSEKEPDVVELENRNIARRSLVAATAIRKGEIFSKSNLTMKRPGGGIPPIQYWDYLGRPAKRDYAPDEVIEP